jgi:hypothetical protein
VIRELARTLSAGNFATDAAEGNRCEMAMIASNNAPAHEEFVCGNGGNAAEPNRAMA